MPATTARDYAETALLEHLITGTLSDDDRTTNLAVALLNATRTCACCGNSMGWAALTVADRILGALSQDLPGDQQNIVATFEHDGDVRTAELQLARVSGVLTANAEEAVRFLLALAAGVCQDNSGLTVRSSYPGATDQVRGWSIGHGVAIPLNRAQIFDAYCTDAVTGEPLPPCPQTEYCDAFILR